MPTIAVEICPVKTNPGQTKMITLFETNFRKNQSSHHASDMLLLIDMWDMGSNCQSPKLPFTSTVCTHVGSWFGYCFHSDQFDSAPKWSY